MISELLLPICVLDNERREKWCDLLETQFWDHGVHRQRNIQFIRLSNDESVCRSVI